MDRRLERERFVERTVELVGTDGNIDEETCLKMGGIYDEERGVCILKIREAADKPNEIEIVKLTREVGDFRR